MTALKSQLQALLASFLLFAAAASSFGGEEWESTVTPFKPGSFPELRPVRVSYGFGWNGFTAGKAEVHLAKLPNGRFQFEMTGGTIGMARSLWEYDIHHTALSDAVTLRPILVREVETVRASKMTNDLTFTPEGVTSVREEREDSSVKSKTRRFHFPNVLSLNSALLYLRTQPLPDGAVQRTVVYPATSAYLCSTTVQGRDRITVPTGTYQAIKVDVQLKKIGKKRRLQPHKKFRKATVWLSDDADRLILRIEAQIFVGKVFAELQSVQFEDPKP
ncbi:MAG: DUF3108 domain-containing protein [Chthoniobacterales bacterium]